MAQTIEAIFHHGNDQRIRDFTPSGAALVSGEVIQIGAGNLAAVCISPEGVADGVLGAVAMGGVWKIKKNAVDVFALGAKVSWDDTANIAVPNADLDEDWKVGVCVERAAAAADDFVIVDLNEDLLA